MLFCRRLFCDPDPAAFQTSITSITISTPGKPDLASSLTTSTSIRIGRGGGQAELDLLEAGKAKPRRTGALALFPRNRTPPPR